MWCHFRPGGLTDVMARMVAQKLTESLEQPVVVDNKPGANANLGADIVAKARRRRLHLAGGDADTRGEPGLVPGLAV